MNEEYKIYSLGCKYYAEGNYTRALKYFKKTISLNPKSAPALNNLGNIYKNTHDYTKALKYYLKALEYMPTSAIILTNIGLVQKHKGNWREAINYYKKAIEADPNYFEAYYNLGIAHYNTDKYKGAINCLSKTVELNPNFDHAKSFLTFLKLQVCDWNNLPSYDPEIDSPIFSITRFDNSKINLKAAKYWSSQLEKKMESYPKFIHKKIKLSLHGKKGKEKITIGYVSNDFYNHATSYLINGLFSNHDKGKFKINIYSYGPNKSNYYLNKFKKEVNNFVDISRMSDYEAAQKIYSDNVDILIDLKGFTGDTRLEIFALKPSPIQVAWLGFPGTTGSSFIDYIIADKIATPKINQKYYSEKFIYMPHSYQLNDINRKILNIKYKRKDFNLPEKDIVFCCFNRPTKIEPKVFSSWMNILKRVPNSVLWLWKENNLMVKNLQMEAIKKKINPKRLIFSPSLPADKHLARLKLADLALDTFIYNGHTTTSDSLWAGVPVVTLKGSHFASRVSASLLSAINLPELITNSQKEYENMAVKLVTNRKKIDTIRLTLLSNRLSTPLFDTKKYVENLEKKYVRMLKAYLK